MVGLGDSDLEEYLPCSTCSSSQKKKKKKHNKASHPHLLLPLHPK